MSSEEVQPLDTLGRESSAADPQPAEELPKLDVQSTVDRWKSKTAVKDYGPPPRLGIRHIMAWTVCWGMYVAIVRQFLQGESSPLLLMILAVSGFGSSAAMFGFSVFVTRRVLRRNWTIEPGEWLLLNRGWQIMCAFLVPLASLLNAFTDSWIASWTGWIAVALFYCVPYIVPLFTKSLPRLWKLLFVLQLSIKGASVLVSNWYSSEFVLGRISPSGTNEVLVSVAWAFVNYHSIIISILPLLFAAIDFRQRGKYTWLHWLGVASGVFEGVAAILLWCLYTPSW